MRKAIMKNQIEYCEKCNKGYLYNGDVVTKCECLKQFQDKINLQSSLMRAGIYDDAEFRIDSIKGNTDSILKVKKYIENIETTFNRKSNLYLVGPNGTQKSYTSKCIITECLKKNVSCKFVIMNDLLSYLTDIYENGYNENIEKFYECDVLVIDDAFDTKKVTIFKSGYQIPFLDAFLRKRMEQLGKNIIFTSNVFINDIDENKFSKDIKNLLQRSILHRQGQLLFDTVYSSIQDSDILSMWN